MLGVTRIPNDNDLSYVYSKTFNGTSGRIAAAGDLLRDGDSMTVDDILQLKAIHVLINRMEPNKRNQTEENYSKNQATMRQVIEKSFSFSLSQRIQDIIDSCEREHKTCVHAIIAEKYGRKLPPSAENIISAYLGPSVAELMTSIKDNLRAQEIAKFGQPIDPRYTATMNNRLDRQCTEYDKAILSITSHATTIAFGIEFLCMTKDMDIMQRNKLLRDVIPQILTNHFTLGIHHKINSEETKKDLEKAVRKIILATIAQNEY